MNGTMFSFHLYECFVFSQGDAVCEPDGPAGLWHRLHFSAALHPTGVAAGSGELGGQEVRTNPLSADELTVLYFKVACKRTELCVLRLVSDAV